MPDKTETCPEFHRSIEHRERLPGLLKRYEDGRKKIDRWDSTKEAACAESSKTSHHREDPDGQGAQFAFDFAGIQTASDVPVGRPTSVDWVLSIEIGKCHENVRAFGDGSFSNEPFCGIGFHL